MPNDNFKLSVAGSLSAVDTLYSNSAIFTNVSATNIDNVNYVVTTITNPSLTFTNQDNSKGYHFNTTVNSITGIFPNTLSNGFNVSITNVGTGTVFISSEQTPFLKAAGIKNETQYTSILVYKHNNELFGVGVFE